MIKTRPKYPTDLYGTIYIDKIQKAVVICLIIPTIFSFDAISSIKKYPDVWRTPWIQHQKERLDLTWLPYMLIISHFLIQAMIRIDTYFFNQIMTISQKGADKIRRQKSCRQCLHDNMFDNVCYLCNSGKYVFSRT